MKKIIALALALMLALACIGFTTAEDKKAVTLGVLVAALNAAIIAVVGIDELISLQKDALGRELVWRVGRVG